MQHTITLSLSSVGERALEARLARENASRTPSITADALLLDVLTRQIAEWTAEYGRAIGASVAAAVLEDVSKVETLETALAVDLSAAEVVKAKR